VAVSAPSRAVLERVRSYYGLQLPHAEVIPNPTLPVSPDHRWRLEECDPARVLFVGRFDRIKGGDLMIEAFGRVLQRIPRARLCFAGPDRGLIGDDGRAWKLEDFVRDRIPAALESGRVEWLGQQPFTALASLRRQAMVSVVCSRYESFPNTVTEAMALGCPIVAARAGGIPEAVHDSVNGLLHQPGDAGDLADKIVALLQDPVQAAKLGRRAAEDCERLFYPDVVASNLVAFYRRVIQRRAERR
jgi:glycosyltransferase involved in cell wall biosynthesis